MSVITTDTGRMVFKKAESLMMVPYVYNSTLGDYVLGDNVYDLSAVIGDSIVLEQSDGNTVTKENEFVSSPLIQNISGAKYGFTAQCLDLQDDVLKLLYDVKTAFNRSNTPEKVVHVAAFNDDYVQMYTLIRIRFADPTVPDVILPKVQMNNKLFLQQLKTRAGQGNISGTALAMNVAVEDKSNSGYLLNFGNAVTGVYTVYTPVLFVPKGYTPIFFRNETAGRAVTYSAVDFSSGMVSEVSVTLALGTWVSILSQ